MDRITKRSVYALNGEEGELRQLDTKTRAKVMHLGEPDIAVLRGIDREDENP